MEPGDRLYCEIQQTSTSFPQLIKVSANSIFATILLQSKNKTNLDISASYKFP